MDRKHNRFWRGIVSVVLCVILLVPEQAVCAAAPDAVPTARAMLAGGIDVMEITFRTAAAADSIRRP